MAYLSETKHEKRLKEKEVNIRTTYISGDRLVVRNTDATQNEDVVNGIRCRKEYFIRGKSRHIETFFDSRIEYTYVSDAMSKEAHSCANCGFSGVVSDFINGCPYCGSPCNVEYTDRDPGSKYHYDYVVRKPLYRIITAVVDVIVSLFLAFVFIISTSRTFNGYDIAKIFIYGGILSLILYYFFYLYDAYAVIGTVKSYKEKQNLKQAQFWQRTGYDRKYIYNRINTELNRRYYSQDDIIDYDIIDYVDFDENVTNKGETVIVSLDVRVVTLTNNRIKTRYITDKFEVPVSENNLKLRGGINIIKCPKCNADIDAGKGVCDYCKTEITSFLTH